MSKEDPSEDQIQAAFWLRAWNEYPHARRHMWAVPNGLHLAPIHAAKAKSTGLLSGVWDLHLFWAGQFHIIETKRPGQTLTVDRVVNGKKVYGQKEWGGLMASHGAIRHIYTSVEEGIKIFESIVGHPDTIS